MMTKPTSTGGGGGLFFLFHRNLPGNSPSSPGEFWPSNVGGGWATAFVISFLFLWQLLRALSRFLAPVRHPPPKPSQQQTPSPSPFSSTAAESSSSLGPSKIISDADLRHLIDGLDGKINNDDQCWENVIEKTNGLISYNAKCCRPKDGPLKYLSITTFEKCSTELLRDFYMDNEYRKKWDKTVLEHKRLEVDEVSAIEYGHTIKKFPLLTPREYVLAWRMWEGKDKTFYCFIKDCEHPLAPRQKKFVRVGFFRSGWRIRKVPGQDACEIKMVHQEDAGLNIEMARLAFAKGIWSYVCKMNGALREYSSWIRFQSSPPTPLRLIQVPVSLESDSEVATSSPSEVSDNTSQGWQEQSSRKPSKKWIAKGLLLLGGVVCLSRGHSTLATQLAMACFLKKLIRHGEEAEESDEGGTSQQVNKQGRWTPRQRNWSQRSSHGVPLSPTHARGMYQPTQAQ